MSYEPSFEPNVQTGTRAEREASARGFQAAFRATMAHYREWTESQDGVFGLHARGPGNAFGWDWYMPAAPPVTPDPSIGRGRGGWPDAPPLWWLCARLVDERDLVRVPLRAGVLLPDAQELELLTVLQAHQADHAREEQLRRWVRSTAWLASGHHTIMSTGVNDVKGYC